MGFRGWGFTNMPENPEQIKPDYCPAWLKQSEIQKSRPNPTLWNDGDNLVQRLHYTYLNMLEELIQSIEMELLISTRQIMFDRDDMEELIYLICKNKLQIWPDSTKNNSAHL